jgi:hypothetical protein
MPKKNKKAKSHEATAQSNDDFDDMLAELRATDLTATAVNTNNSSSSSSSITSTNVASTASSTAKAIEVSEERILEAVERGDIAQLRRWGRLGLRITSGQPLVRALVKGNLDALRCLVKDLGADVNQADRGPTLQPLHIAVHLGNIDMVHCLVNELGADVNQRDMDGTTHFFYAAKQGDLAMMRYLAN